jgi:hypothetical protein
MSKKYNEFKEWIEQSNYGFIDVKEMELESDQRIFEKFESERNDLPVLSPGFPFFPFWRMP